MQNLRYDDYSEGQKATIESFTLAQVEMLLTRSFAVRCPDPIIKAWDSPNLTQVKYLEIVQRRKYNAEVFKPTQIQERVLMGGGKIEYKSVQLPFTSSNTVGFTTTLPDAKESEWIVDVVPVEKSVAITRPGIGRLIAFCSTMTCVKKKHVVPVFDTMQSTAFEVQIVNHRGVTHVCSLLESIFTEQKMVIPDGASGSDWADKLYTLISSSSMNNYDGLSSMIVSHCYKIGSVTGDDGNIVPSPDMEKLIEKHTKIADALGTEYKLPGTILPWAPGRLTAYKQAIPGFNVITLPAYLVGDIYSDGKQLKDPVAAPGVYSAMQSISQARGGKSGAMALLTGRYSLGVPSASLARLEEMLTILIALDTPYNVVGLELSHAQIYKRAKDAYGSVAHRFVTDTGETKSGCIWRAKSPDYPTITFSQKNADNEYHYDIRMDAQARIAEHRKAQREWYSCYFGDTRNIWVGCNILPYAESDGVSSEESDLPSMKAHYLGVAFDGRGVFSLQDLCQAFHVDTKIGDDGVERRTYKRNLLPFKRGAEWGAKVFNDVMKVPGYVVHPPRFVCRSVASLVPSFKDVKMYRYNDDSYEMIGVDEKLQYAPSATVINKVADVKPRTIDFGPPISLPADIGVVKAPIINTLTLTSPTISTTTTGTAPPLVRAPVALVLPLAAAPAPPDDDSVYGSNLFDETPVLFD